MSRIQIVIHYQKGQTNDTLAKKTSAHDFPT